MTCRIALRSVLPIALVAVLVTAPATAMAQAATAPIQAVRADGQTQVYLEDTTTNPNNQVMLWMKKSTKAPIVRYQSEFRQWDFTGGQFFTINDPSDAAIEMKVSAAGDMTIEGNYLNLPGAPVPDFVFEDDYSLMSLEELRAYLAQEKHLPDIPSAAELEEQGHVNVSKMQMLLLQKIEELTLYVLQQQQEIDALKAQQR